MTGMKSFAGRAVAAAAPLVVALVSALLPEGVSAQGKGPIQCGGVYSVVRGDTLREIAIRAYQVGNYQIIFNANRDVLKSVSIIEVNDRLFIPCLDGSGPKTKQEFRRAGGVTDEPLAELAVIQPVEDQAPLQPFQRKIRFLTASDFAPFTEEDMPQGGMITELVKRAMGHSGSGRDYRVTFVNDWGAHLDVLLPEGAFDLGFPWYRPDCTKIDRLSDAMKLRCTSYDFSHPFYEVVIGYYARTDNQLSRALSYDDLSGKVICRPRGYFTFDLEQEGLTESGVTLMSPQTPIECFEALRDGEADIATINILIAEQAIAELGIGGETTEIADLASIQTLHVLSPKSNPYGRAYLTLINKGLRQMRESGEWFEVVSRHLADHAKRTQ
ncbi:MAG: transporter substrate-binding domain-containing protein [Pseudomonadota bacterium]